MSFCGNHHIQCEYNEPSVISVHTGNLRGEIMSLCNSNNGFLLRYPMNVILESYSHVL